ncbi:hypothetical protein HS088_TW11G00679 [Tripterygium wilfordii]|uniref:Uncharacterized protein n=1 Tax=Tripterygium wilfordii TaxID=458696 RepID=A0A7J7D2Q8_TRIWF|nr:uncharacterized protein LOC120009544 [Tripterygium wilfordii]KAF5740603.1 hypothetical protein HS088_TW11G00679 [Tripterygium wilfordii]
MRNTNHHNKFIRFITYPIRVLGKAKEFYVRSLSDYANSGVGYGGGMGVPGGSIASLPKSFSVNSSRSEESDMDYAELLRVASLKSSRSGRHGHGLSEMGQSSSTSTGLRKSCSVAMGRIDEDRPCDNFVEVGGVGANYNKDFLYPRSRSYAVPKRNLMF